MESKSSWFFRIKWGLVAGKIRGKEGLTGVDEKHVFYFLGGGRGDFIVVDGHDSCFQENCMISGRYDKADSIVAL